MAKGFASRIRVQTRGDSGARPCPDRRAHLWADAFSLAVVLGVFLADRALIQGRRAGESGALALRPASSVAGATGVDPVSRRRRLPPWASVLWRAWTDFSRDNITLIAGGVTFFAVVAVFPALAAFVSIYGLVSDVASAEHDLNLLRGVVPREALAMLHEEMIRVAATHSSALGLTLAGSVALSVWSANAGVKSLILGLNITLEQKEKRNFFVLNLVSLGFTVGALLLVGIGLSLLLVVPALLKPLRLAGGDFAFLRWPLLLAAALGALCAFYRWGPSRKPAPWRFIWPGAAVAAALWIVASAGFSLYVANFGSYNRTYGSLGVAVGFMTWIWITSMIGLLGAELNSEIEADANNRVKQSSLLPVLQDDQAPAGRGKRTTPAAPGRRMAKPLAT